jgi:DNA-binding NtrC family response regulator
MTATRPQYRVMVIDDDETLARMIGQMLRRMGYLSVVCYGPTRALALFSRASHRFNAVVLDEIMPGLRGTELIPKLLQIKKDIPIILMTGHGDMLSLEKIRKSGARATLLKPVLMGRLEETLSRLLRP